MNLNRVAEQTRQNPVALYKVPEIDAEILYLFRHYCNIKGQEPITFTELEAWQNITGNELSPGEIEILFKLDAAFYATRRQNE